MAEFKDVMKRCNEMCDSYRFCTDGCPLRTIKNKYNTDCHRLMRNNPEEAEAAIMAWTKPVDWSKVEVDTKILVRGAEYNSWSKRHFAKYENGKVYAWDDGATSFTANGEVTEWEFAKLAEGGEQNG